MSAILNSLKLVSAKRPTDIPAIQVRRNKLSNKLFEQIKLATAISSGSTYAPLRMRTVRDRHTGETKHVEMARRMRQWWFTSESGKICVQLRYGSKTLEIAKNKNSVEVATSDELVKVLETLKLAVEAGELDQQLESAGMKLRDGFGK